MVVIATTRSCIEHMASRHNDTFAANRSKIDSAVLKYHFP